MGMGCGRNQRIHRLLRRAPGGEQGQPTLAQPRVGAMLRQHSARARRAMDHPGPNGDIGGGGGGAELAGGWAAGSDRKGHIVSMSRHIPVPQPGKIQISKINTSLLAAGIVQLLVPVVPLSSARPLTRLALDLLPKSALIIGGMAVAALPGGVFRAMPLPVWRGRPR
jgi:hypothetical protein